MQCGADHAAEPGGKPERLDRVEQEEAEVPPAATWCGSQPAEAPRNNCTLIRFTGYQKWFLSEITEHPGPRP
eukprot:9069355-Alexandrium_andersonii.AAC.1